METLWQDLRYSLRMLRKSPGFSAVAVLTLALGIGATSAIFSVVNSILLRPLPYKDPDRLVSVRENDLRKGYGLFSVSPPNFFDWKKQNQVFEDMTAYTSWLFSLTGGDEPERILGARVSASFFSLLGLKPILGRPFLPEEERPDGPRVVVIGHGLWQRRFGGKADLIGKALTLNGEPYTVVGIMPARFQFPERAELWIPITLNADELVNRGSRLFFVVARLKRGVRLEQARMEMDTLARRLAAQYPETNAGWGVNLVPLHENIVRNVQPALFVLLGAVGFVLLIACANLANLLLARAAVRRREIAIRAAIGASRRRLVRQLLTESVLLALLGGAWGLLLTFWGVDLLIALMPANIPRQDGIGIDGHVLGFALIISLLTGLVSGLAPALETSKPDLSEALKEGGGRSALGLRRRRVRRLLVIYEIALALVLLVGAGLMIKSFLRLLSVDLGFHPENVLTMQIELPEPKYSRAHRRINFYQRLLERVEALPGVRHAGTITALPLSGENHFVPLTIPGRPPLASPEELKVNYRAISPNYFRAMGIPLRKGRYFTEQDISGGPGVAIINETMARRFWLGYPLGPDLLGNGVVLKFPPQSGGSIAREIVGVVGDVRHWGLDTDPKPEIYVPYPQNPWPFLTLVVRTTSDPRTVAAAVRREVLAVDKDQPVYNVRAMGPLVSHSVAPRRFYMLLLSIFAALAIVLAAVGVYGVINYSVTQRTHEIGLRMALGAEPHDVLRWVVGEGMVLTLIGLGVGMAAAFGLTRFLAGLLYGVTPTDPATFAGVALLLGAVAFVACYIPARRATKVDPMIALRYE